MRKVTYRVLFAGPQAAALTKRQVKRAVYLPKLKDIKTVSEAWDYAAKVCLRMHKAIIRFPLDNQEDDDKLSTAVYKHFAELLGNLHSMDQINLFESRQYERLLKLKNITKVKKKDNQINEDSRIRENEQANIEKNSGWKDPYEETMHMPLPRNTGSIAKLSIAFLYAAIVCKTLSDFFKDSPYSCHTGYIRGIYTNFYSNSFYYDERSRRDWIQWIKIYDDVKKHGYNAASSLNAVVLDSEDNKSKTKVQVKLSVKHIRNKQSKTKQLLQDIRDYFPFYSELLVLISEIIKHDTSSDKEGTLHNFNINERILNNGEFDRYNYYFIKHYDPSKKSKIRWCPISLKNLAGVTVLGYRYYQFENMIKSYVGVINNYNNFMSEHHQQLQILLFAYEILQKIGFKRSHISDKIKSNIRYFINRSD